MSIFLGKDFLKSSVSLSRSCFTLSVLNVAPHFLHLRLVPARTAAVNSPACISARQFGQIAMVITTFAVRKKITKEAIRALNSIQKDYNVQAPTSNATCLAGAHVSLDVIRALPYLRIFFLCSNKVFYGK